MRRRDLGHDGTGQCHRREVDVHAMPQAPRLGDASARSRRTGATLMTDTAPNLLEMRSITKSFPGVTALAGVSLVVREGEIHAICGENGAGKSTLMKVLSGVHPHGSYTGDIVYQGKKARFDGIRASEQAGIVIIHQELALVPGMSITENLFLGNEPRRRGSIDWK